jgi:hypothetical protein
MLKQKIFVNKTFNKHLTSKLQVSPNFTLDSVADSNCRGKCDVGGFLIFEWTLVTAIGIVGCAKIKIQKYPSRE